MTSNLKHNFSEIYKHGLKPVIPDWVNKEVYSDWIMPNDKILFQEEKKGTYCVATFNDGSFYFLRFFNIGDNTNCSVDFESDNETKLLQKLILLLRKEHLIN